MLVGANLSMVDFTEAVLIGANLAGTTIRFAAFHQADLTEANFRLANLFCVYQIGANLSKAILGATSIAMCDLSQCIGLDTVQHDGSSSIGVDTLIASLRGAGNEWTAQLETFFRGAGVPEEFLKALPDIVREIEYYSCFICYGEPDRMFAEKLVKDLEAKGVSCWLHPIDYTPGERTWEEIGQKRREAEKMVVLCSAKSLLRDGVLKEIEEQIDEDPDKIVPVSLVELWKEPGFPVKRGNRDLKPFLMDRNYADFSDPSKYEESLDRLLKGVTR